MFILVVVGPAIAFTRPPGIETQSFTTPPEPAYTLLSHKSPTSFPLVPPSHTRRSHSIPLPSLPLAAQYTTQHQQPDSRPQTRNHNGSTYLRGATNRRRPPSTTRTRPTHRNRFLGIFSLAGPLTGQDKSSLYPTFDLSDPTSSKVNEIVVPCDGADSRLDDLDKKGELTCAGCSGPVGVLTRICL